MGRVQQLMGFSTPSPGISPASLPAHPRFARFAVGPSTPSPGISPASLPAHPRFARFAVGSSTPSIGQPSGASPLSPAYARKEARFVWGGPTEVTLSSPGFTLLEVVISIVLLVSIVLIAAGAMRLAYRSVANGQRKTDALERMRTSFFIINAQIESASPLLTAEDGSKQVQFEGARDSLRLATNYSIWAGRMGHVVVEYRVARDDLGRESLYATERIAETGKQRETMLFRGYDNIYFQYSDTIDPDVAEEWADQWSDPEKTPWKVKVVLISGRNAAIAFIIPVRVHGPFASAAPGAFFALTGSSDSRDAPAERGAA